MELCRNLSTRLCHIHALDNIIKRLALADDVSGVVINEDLGELIVGGELFTVNHTGSCHS